ncbi:MAG: tetratricopeptide repeat protein [Bryobacteraceae bacterium]|nr:tetratricopeptide repeat protein [Bryobacteraceae bacterium]
MFVFLAAPFLFLTLWGQQGAVSFSDPAREAARLRAAIESQPDVEAHYTDLGNLLLRTQNFPQAAMVLETARQRFPASAQVVLSLGVAYYGQRKFMESVGAFLEAGRLAPDVEQPVAFLSRLSEHWNERRNEVETLFSGYAKRNPESATGQFALGKLKADAAILRRAVQLNPRFAEAYFELGTVLESARDYPRALESYHKAAQFAPRNPAPHHRLSRIYARTGEKVKAEQERALHEKLSAEEKASLDRRQAATKHLSFEGGKK